jgi:hypothetical protein
MAEHPQQKMVKAEQSYCIGFLCPLMLEELPARIAARCMPRNEGPR